MNNTTSNLNEELQEALCTLNLGAKAERNSAIVTSYWGLDGKGGPRGGFSMEAVAKPYSLTREMVRQITNKIAAQAPGTKSSLPILKRCGKIIDSMLPCEARSIEKAISDEGITRDGFRIEGIISALDIFGIKTNVHSIIQHKTGRFVIANEKQEEWASEIISKAGSVVSHNGAASVLLLAKEITSKKETKIKTELAINFVRSVVSCREENDVFWIDEKQDWFFFTEIKRNRVLTRAKKIYSICNSCHVSQIQEGILRSFNKDKNDEFIILPDLILINLLEATGDFKSNGSGNIVATKTFNPDGLLREFETLIINEILRSETGIVFEGDLERRVVYKNSADDAEAAKNKYGFSVALNFSPVIKRISRGQYSLVGSL
jgi:hypothetical protein